MSMSDELPRDDLVRAIHPGFELRASENANGMPTLVSRFIQYNTFTEIDSAYEGHFMERIAPGALKKTLAENRDQIKVLLEHGKDPTVGNKPLGAIQEIRDQGGHAVGIVPLLDTSYVRDLVPALEQGLYGSSFRFKVVKQDVVRSPERSATNPDGLPERTITELKLYEFGPVLFPAYDGATAGVRSMTDEYLAARSPLTSKDTPHALKPDPAVVERVDAEDLATLAQMIQAGTDYIADQDEPEDQKNIPVMEGILGELSKLVTVEAEEVEPVEPEDEENSAGTVGETAAAGVQGKQREEPEHSPEASRTTPKPDTQTTSEHKETKHMNLEEMRSRLDEIRATLEEIATENRGRKLDAEADARWKELTAERDELAEGIRETEERQAYLESITETKPSAVERGAGSSVARAARNKAPDDVFDMTEYHTRSTSQEHMGRLYEEGAKRAVDGMRFPNENPRFDQEQARAAAQDILDKDSPDKEIAQRLLIHGSPVYRNAFWKTIAKQPLSPEEQRKMHEGMMLESRSLTAAGDGGITVPVQIDPTVLLTSTGAINPFREVSKIVRTTSYQWQGVTSTGITAQYRAEGAAMADNSPTLVAPAINPERADAFVPYTWEAAQDWASLEGEMASMFADAKDVLEATKFASGAGHGSNEPLGVLVGAGTVVGSSATTTVGTVDIYALEAALPVRFQPNAVWLATPALFSRIRLQAALGSNSGGIWADSLQVGQPARLLGYPAYKASSVGTAGNQAVSVASTKWGIFGDFSKFAIVDRIGFQVRPIENLFNGNTAGGIAYPNGMSGLVCYWRNSSGVLASNAFRTGTVT